MTKLAEWSGTGASILGAFLLPLGYPFIGYIAFLSGSCLLLGTAIISRNRALATLNATFLIANILGLAKNF